MNMILFPAWERAVWEQLTSWREDLQNSPPTYEYNNMDFPWLWIDGYIIIYHYFSMMGRNWENMRL